MCVVGKRDNNKFERASKDRYLTIDPGCLVPGFIDRVRGKTYAEPCWGAGDLEDLLMEVATCKWRSDVKPQVGNIPVRDASTLTPSDLQGCDLIITNPPYQWTMLKPLLDTLPKVKPTWLLLPGDYMFNIRMGSYMKQCKSVVAVGRMYWFKSVQAEGWLAVSDYLGGKKDEWVYQRSEMIGGALKYKGWWCPRRDIPTESETTKGTDNMAWYFFDPCYFGITEFVGRGT